MSDHALSEIDRPLVQSHNPANFAGRGVAVPFVTPELAGARARAALPSGIEFIIPNPSGGRGVYILDWDGVRRLCQPTVHDTLLQQRLAGLAALAPISVRLAGRALAAEGMAGRAARDAARAATERDLSSGHLANFLLLMTLVEQVEPSGLTISEVMPRTPDLLLRARHVLAQMAPRIGHDARAIADDIEKLGALFAPVGIGARHQSARLPALVGRMRALHASILHDAETEAGRRLAASLAASCGVFIRCADSLILQAHAATNDMVGLLRDDVAEPRLTDRLTGRPEWVLDGWDQICLLWETASAPAARRDVLAEMLRRVPPLPREAMDWVGDGLTDDMLEPNRVPEQNDRPPRGAALVAAVARNEKLRGLAL